MSRSPTRRSDSGEARRARLNSDQDLQTNVADDADEPDDHGATLEAYRHAKWTQLEEEGVAPLRRELAKLQRYLERADDPHVERMNIDEGFRRAKAQALEEILQAAAAGDEASDDPPPRS